MKLSVSLTADDVAFLDEYARLRGYPSRSAALHAAVRSLRSSTLGDAYAAAWAEQSADDVALWDATGADGLDTG